MAKKKLMWRRLAHELRMAFDHPEYRYQHEKRRLRAEREKEKSMAEIMSTSITFEKMLDLVREHGVRPYQVRDMTVAGAKFQLFTDNRSYEAMVSREALVAVDMDPYREIDWALGEFQKNKLFADVKEEIELVEQRHTYLVAMSDQKYVIRSKTDGILAVFNPSAVVFIRPEPGGLKIDFGHGAWYNVDVPDAGDRQAILDKWAEL